MTPCRRNTEFRRGRREKTKGRRVQKKKKERRGNRVVGVRSGGRSAKREIPLVLKKKQGRGEKNTFCGTISGSKEADAGVHKERVRANQELFPAVIE